MHPLPDMLIGVSDYELIVAVRQPLEQCRHILRQLRSLRCDGTAIDSGSCNVCGDAAYRRYEYAGGVQSLLCECCTRINNNVMPSQLIPDGNRIIANTATWFANATSHCNTCP